MHAEWYLGCQCKEDVRMNEYYLKNAFNFVFDSIFKRKMYCFGAAMTCTNSKVQNLSKSFIRHV